MRYLRKNHRTSVPQSILCVDTETEPSASSVTGRKKEHRLMMGCCKYMRFHQETFVCEDTEWFNTTEGFWDIVADRLDEREILHIFSHRAAFDATICGLWEKVEDGRVNLGYLVSSDPPTIISGSVSGRPFTWLDTLNWVRLPLEEIAADFDLEKPPLPGDNGTEEEWKERCEADTEILKHLVQSIILFNWEHDLGNWRPTAPGQAMQAYKHRFMPQVEVRRTVRRKGGRVEKIVEKVGAIMPHDDPVVKKLERSGYHQGLAFVPFVGRVVPKAELESERSKRDVSWLPAVAEGPVYVCDVNSMYGSVMAGFEHPRKLIGVVPHPTVGQLLSAMTSGFCIANVLINAGESMYPVKVRGECYLGGGTYWTTLCGVELKAAFLADRVLACHIASWYETADLFSEYVKYFDGIKQEGHNEGCKWQRTLAKLYCNGLYGKWSQRVGGWQTVNGVQPKVRWGMYDDIDPADGRRKLYRGLGSLCQVREELDDAEHTLTAISASITSYARALLWQFVDVAGWENIFYMNIDSLHVNEAGFRALEKAGWLHDTKMGMLKVDGPYQRAEYRNIRDYSLDGKDTIAGLSRKSERIGPREWRELTFERLDAILQRPSDTSVIVEEDVSCRWGLYDGGVILPSGRVRPILFGPGATDPMPF